MAPSTIRKAIGAVKDQTSIGIAKVASNMAPDLEVAIVKATSHDDDPADEKYIREILNLTSYSRGYVHACVSAVSKRLGKTRDWIVALKALTLIHRLLNDGDPIFQDEILYATRRGTRLLNMSDFRDEAHSSSWDQSAFVRTYAMYLDQRLELVLFDRKGGSNSASGSGSHQNGFGSRYGDDFRSPPPRPNEYDYGDARGDSGYGNYGMTRRSRSYGDMSEATGREEKKATVNSIERNEAREDIRKNGTFAETVGSTVLRPLMHMRVQAKQIDELIAFYNWCKDTGVARSSEYPDVQRITSKLLETLEEFVRDRAKRPKSPERKELEAPPQEEPVPDMNEIKALPPPEDYTPPPPPEPEPEPEPEPQKPQVTEDLVNLRDDAVTADDQGNKFALALFNGPAANGNGSWEAFPSNGAQITSAWQTPAAEPGKADWELALVESASNLSRQKAALGGGLDPLLLNGMYDQGMGPGKPSTPVLALPAPDGTVQAVNQDPFAASSSIPPPSYVQMSDMEKKQHLLVQEQQVWQQYGRDGMQGQASLAKLTGTGYYNAGPMPVMPYGMPPVNGMGPPAGYYYTPY
ncbi:hypothetical protein Patl1_12470 [Pistacia atlantica]|uniref:Uncharacterized protein n=1 Tax=Pistacia atlantica TaxID=434234 RepID=A0ACC1AUE3_9ROSI|nr:hypothetical protein Patl1_12470 [Pistacia atlantica]